ncbi:MAG: hypothetical protein Q8N47_16525 [Bryobacterales bacterium]|nr:hypothetical protein [Bryobacterales bacterium]
MRNKALFLLCATLLCAPLSAKVIGINVVLNTPLTGVVLTDLGRFGKVRDVVPEIRAVTLQADDSRLAAIRALRYVVAANPDMERKRGPVRTAAVTSFTSTLTR